MISVRLASQVIVRHGKNSKIAIAIFLDTSNMINVKLCMLVLLVELYPIYTTFTDPWYISGSQQCQSFH